MDLGEKIKFLSVINSPMAGFDKRFIADVPGIFAKTPEKISDKQKIWIDKLLYKYRRQWLKHEQFNVAKLTEIQFRYHILKYKDIE